MNATTKNLKNEKKMTVDTAELQQMLCCGRKTAVDIGTAAGGMCKVGRRVLWNVSKIQKYLDTISK